MKTSKSIIKPVIGLILLWCISAASFASYGPIDFTDKTLIDATSINVQYSRMVLNRRTGNFEINAELTNISSDSISGPLYFTIEQISSPDVSIVNHDAVSTQDIPYFLLNTTQLDPNDTLSLKLKFSYSSRARFTFTEKIYSSAVTGYTVGGTVSGYTGKGLVLQNNDGDDLVIDADGNFSFATALPDGSAYAVTVLTPPVKPTQRCTVENGEGFLNAENANVTVNCRLLLFISADDGLVGRELFATDGTAAGTFLVKDININASSDPSNLVVVDGVTYFVATNGINGRELWKTSGAVDDVVMVKDIRPGSGNAFTHRDSNLVAVGNTLYFRAYDGVNAFGLWKSDGTAAGTVMVKYTWPDERFNGFAPEELTAMGNTLYFSANDWDGGYNLWKSDGTDAGTVKVNSGGYDIFPEDLTVVGNTLYFSADTGSNLELVKSDGTDAGTVRVKPGQDGALFPRYLTVVGDTLYFSAYDDFRNGIELWKSDGTDAGTVMVKNIRPGSSGAFPDGLTAVGNTLYFTADDGINGRELWKSDGTAVGTVMVKNIWPGSGSALPQLASVYSDDYVPSTLTAVGRTLYFTAQNGVNGMELWKSDGTDAGTVLVKDIRPGSGSASPFGLRAEGNTLYFNADDGTNGRELWKSDGTYAGTVMVKDINPNSGASSNPVPLNAN